MRKEEIKKLRDEALSSQKKLEEIEVLIWEYIRSEIRSMSSFGEHAYLENMVFHPVLIEVKVVDGNYDLYESEIIRLTYDKLAELMP